MITGQNLKQKKVQYICLYDPKIVYRSVNMLYKKYVIFKQVGTRLGDEDGNLILWNIKALNDATHDELNDLYLFISDPINY